MGIQCATNMSAANVFKIVKNVLKICASCNPVLHMGLLCVVPPVQRSHVSLAPWLYVAVVLETLVMGKSLRLSS